MRKNIRNRLEKALITLQEPEGSTVRSIIKTINKETPILSLRKLLEALQEGINEGFLCMYNGRFKLRQQLNSERERRGSRLFDKANLTGQQGSRNKTPDIDQLIDDSDFESDEEEEDMIKFKSETDAMLKKETSKPSREVPDKNTKRFQRFVPSSNTKKKQRFLTKEETKKSKVKGKGSKKSQKNPKTGEKIACSVLELTSKNIPENKSTASTAKLDVKKQRGPRCTSMKKDVRMPSKVHIPFVPPPVPQRNNNFNDLLRRSPEPVNGPLFDSFTFKKENLELFGIDSRMTNYADSLF